MTKPIMTASEILTELMDYSFEYGKSNDATQNPPLLLARQLKSELRRTIESVPAQMDVETWMECQHQILQALGLEEEHGDK